MEKLKISLALICLSIGIALLTINVYGLFQQIRPTVFFNDELRFKNDQPISFQQAITELNRLENESDDQYAQRATHIIAKGIAHIHWERYNPPKFNQIIPIWENYFLYFMGKFSGIPEYQRYHFANYKRSLERGIGICGDASMILSQVLNKQDIPNNILTFPGHVVVTASFKNGQEAILDADFGVTALVKTSELRHQYKSIAELYTDAGYSKVDQEYFQNMYQQDFEKWRGVEHFITKKYYFEYISYALKWPFPITLIVIPLCLYLRKKRTLSILH